mmetsp:Transcript_10692/g.13889  ORF Transcript_10692/g.13889 Transcript_10692/m.13889 type:complete len:188 (-) Transcript_10692:143-706(-)
MAEAHDTEALTLDELAVLQEPEDEEDLLAPGDEEVLMIGQSVNPAELEFDLVVGALEDILLNEEFVALQRDFFAANCDEFEDTEENKLSYTEIFNNYTTMIEEFLEMKLVDDLPNFSMERFIKQIEEQNEQEEITGDVFEMLSSLGDFMEFKQLILSYKQQQDSPDLEVLGVGSTFQLAIGESKETS